MNYWILQANPKTFLIDYFLDEYIRDNRGFWDWWLVQQKHVGLIKPEDIVYIWKAQSEPARSNPKAREYFEWKGRIGRKERVAGIFAVGKVKTFPKPWRPPTLKLECYQKYQLTDWSGVSNCWVYCEYSDNRVKDPLLQESIWERLGQITNTDLASFKKSRRGRKSVRLESREYKIIESLLSQRF